MGNPLGPVIANIFMVELENSKVPTMSHILAKNYKNRLKRRVAESLFVKENKSSLNIQEDTFKLKLFN